MAKISFMIPLLLFSFQTTGQDINLGPLVGLIGNLGSAGAAVVVVIYFLAYVRDQAKVIEKLKDANLEMQGKYEHSLDDMSKKFISRQEELQDFFERQLRNVTAGQNEILRETILTVKGFEKTLDNLRNDIQLVLVKARPREIRSDDDIKLQDKSK